MKLSKHSKIFFLLFIFVIPLVLVIGFRSYSPQGTLIVSSNDIVKNFHLESLDNSPIPNTLEFEPGTWDLDPLSVNIIQAYQVNDTVYLNYKIIAYNTVNIFTSDSIRTVCENASKVTETFIASTYKHLAVSDWGTRVLIQPTFDWIHYNFYPTTSLQDYVTANNQYSGKLKMVFDINSNPIPSVVADPYGNTAEKQFAYVSVSKAWVSNTEKGQLSFDDPIVSTTLPDPDYAQTYSVDDTYDCDYHDVFTPNFRMTEATIANSYGYINPMTDGSSLQPTDKDGSPLFDPTEDKSASGCALYYNLYALSPYVREYKQQLSWTQRTLIRQDQIIWFLVIPMGVSQYLVSDDTQPISESRDVALQVNNQYIQTTVNVQFSIWSAYKITALVGNTNTTLGLPSEYFNQLVWESTVSGFSGMTVKSSNPDLWWGLGSWTTWLVIIIIVIIGAVGVYIYLRMRKKGIPINISLRK